MFVLLENVKDVNTFYHVDSYEHVNGNGEDIYFQLVTDLSGNCPDAAMNRYVPSSAATVVVNFDNLDCNLVISRVAVQPFPLDDRSIWKVTVMPTDLLQGNMTLTLTDGTKVETLLLEGRLVCSTTKNNRFYA
jgi:hypothetical protein